MAKRPAEASQNRIFLAHAREDKQQVRELYNALKIRGFNPWLDDLDLLPGQNWKLEIPKAIRQATIFVACLSRNSVQKQGYVQTELRLALTAYGERPSEAIYLVPLKLDHCEIPDLQIPDRGVNLRDIHWIEFWQEDALERLIRAMEIILDTSSNAIGDTGFLPGGIFRDIATQWCPEMVVITAGSFVMSSPGDEAERTKAEGPQHKVKFALPFALGRFPVTFEEYDHYCIESGREKPPDQGWGRDRRPAINLSWEDAQAYCAWLSEQTRQAYRLPSEAEWEYACRAGGTAPFWTGPTISTDQANYDGHHTYGTGRKGEYRGQSTPVDGFEANPWGLHDVHGNIWEWCEDCWNDSYEGAPNDGSAWREGNCSARPVRGGSWYDKPRFLRSAFRVGIVPDYRKFHLGFRVSRALTP